MPDEVKISLEEGLDYLQVLDCRQRAIFLEYHYFKTHMKLVAASYKISLGRTYAILYQAEDKLAKARTQEAA